MHTTVCMCPRATVYVCALTTYCMHATAHTYCMHATAHTSCMHATGCVLVPLYMCVLTLLNISDTPAHTTVYMCPHTTGMQGMACGGAPPPLLYYFTTAVHYFVAAALLLVDYYYT